MNALQKVFDYRGAQVRTVIRNKEPWFVARDVCEALELEDVSKAVSRLDEDEKGTNLILTPGGNQEMLIVNEPGLYALVLTSRKPEAKQFKRWVTHEVLPSIRQTGSYSIAQPAPVTPTEALLQTVQILAQQEKQLLQLQAAQTESQQKLEILGHRMEILDSIDTIGDPQQRLNAMVRRYAQQEGLAFPKAWRDFVQAYNTAYHTNLTMLKENYREKKGKKKMTYPEYLAQAEKLEDALRVADKMLNRAS